MYSPWLWSFLYFGCGSSKGGRRYNTVSALSPRRHLADLDRLTREATETRAQAGLCQARPGSHRLKGGSMLRALVLVLLVGFAAPHNFEDWRSKYKSRTGENCCGASDCFEVEVAVLDFVWPLPEKVNVHIKRYKNRLDEWVEADAVLWGIPSKGVHPSEDENAWFCMYYNTASDDGTTELPNYQRPDTQEEFAPHGAVTRDEPCYDYNTHRLKLTKECYRCIFLNYST